MISISIIINGLAFGSILFLIASGLTIILSVMRVINFAHGSLFVFGGYFAFYFSSSVLNFPGEIWVSITLAGVTVAILGLITERILRPMYDREIIYQILITFGLAYCFYDLQLIFFGTVTKSLDTPGVLSRSFTVFNTTISSLKLFYIILGIISMLALRYLFYRTKYGIDARATSFNPEMSMGLGIDTNRTYVVTFAIGAFLAGLGGAATSIWMPLSAPSWEMFNTFAFAVVVIGGLGSIRGAFIASLSVGLIKNLGSLYYPRFSGTFVVLIMAIVLAVRPRGMFGRRQI